MNILFATSEAVPFAKTGGLADVSGALPRALAELGHDVRLILPLFRAVRDSGAELADTGIRVTVPVGEEGVEGELWESKLPGSDVPVYFLGNDEYYDRPGLYGETGAGAHAYADNCQRFVFFSRGILEALLALGFEADVLHLNDWQTALAAVYLRTLYDVEPSLRRMGTLLTIHNLLYQGIFWHWDVPLTGLGWSLFNWRQLEFYGKLNLLKGGLVFSDYINTVSPSYAREIQTAAFGNGLEGVLSERRDRLSGIVNGIDYNMWNPETDELIPAHYSAEDLAGKAKCKAALQKKNKLPVKADAPLVGMISRLVPEKGFDLVLEVVPEVLGSGAQVVLLGTGEPKYHEAFGEMAKEFPKNFAVNLTFNDRLAHEIEAGADIFLMPSRVEPCGLNQLYSLRYGAVPVVRATGGLADTITDFDPGTLTAGEANGFVFERFTAEALAEALGRALTLFRSDPQAWAELRRVAMTQDWSWGRSAGEYQALYELVSEAAAGPGETDGR